MLAPINPIRMCSWGFTNHATGYRLKSSLRVPRGLSGACQSEGQPRVQYRCVMEVWKATNDMASGSELVVATASCVAWPVLRAKNTNQCRLEIQWPDHQMSISLPRFPLLHQVPPTQPKACPTPPQGQGGVVAEADDLLHWGVGSECSHVYPINDIWQVVSGRLGCEDSALG